MRLKINYVPRKGGHKVGEKKEGDRVTEQTRDHGVGKQRTNYTFVRHFYGLRVI